MTHYEREGGGASFDIADKFTVRQQLAYRSLLAEPGEPLFVRHWAATQTVITNWQSDVIADPATFDLDASSDTRAADVIAWASNKVAAHITRQEAVDPND